MPKLGGGHEDFEKALEALKEIEVGRKRLVSGEATSQRALKGTAESESKAAGASRVRAGAKKESAQVEERATRVTKDSTKALDLDTAAVKRNTVARQQADRSRAFNEKAIYGARSPQYRQAYGLYQESGEIPSQYRLRQIPGVGQRRAASMVQAMQAGLKPADEVDVNRPLQRVAAAHEEVAAAEFRLAQATKEHERVKRAGTQDEAQATYATRQDAKSQLQSARKALQDSEDQHTARQESIRAEEENRRALNKEILDRGRNPALVDPRRGLPAPGQTAQGMPLYPAETRTFARVGPIHPDTGVREQEQTIKTMNVQRLALPPAGGTTQGMPVYPAETRTRVTIPGTPPPGPGGAPNWAAGDPERVKALQASAEASRAYSQQAAAQARVAAANRDAAASFYPLSQAMHRHGALTSEFIAAAARGETTLKELGNQAIITAGKFGGWTLAASAVYGVAAALGKVAQGAMDAQSGTQQAYRVINSQKDPKALQSAFSDLSKQFNVPIATASDAVYRMGQVFHDQPSAIKAAEAALLSYKTGEVSVDESTRNLIAIQRAFGLSSNELVSIFDQINAAQNKFGISIGDTEAGLAKAGGTWRNAGGDLDYLLGLFVAIQKATGATGREIGTSLSRLYYVQHPQKAVDLKKLGVDVDLENVQKTYQSAMEVAKKHPENVHEIAVGLVGPQYARLLAATLRNQDTLNKALKETNAEAAKGSGLKELRQVLHQVDEEITQLGNNFERMGVALGKAGVFNWAGLLLRTMNGVLSTATSLINVFNHLPDGLRQGLSMAAELLIAMTALRRLGATERFANTRLGFLSDPAGRQRTHTVVGLRQGRSEAYNRLERYGQINVDRAFDADLQRQLAGQAGARHESLSHLDVQDPVREKARLEYEAQLAKAKRAETALVQSTEQLDAARVVATRAEEELTLAQNTSRRQFEATAVQRGWAYPRKLDQPNTAGIARAGVPIVGPGGSVAAGAAVAEEEGARAAQQASRVTRAIEGRTAQLAIALESMSGAGTLLGRSGRVLSDATVATGARLGAAAGTVEQAGAGMKGMGGRMAAFAGSLGVLDIALLAFFVGEAVNSVVDHFGKQLDELEKYAKKAGDPSTESDIRQLESRAKALKKTPDGTTAQHRFELLSRLNDFVNPVELISNTIPEIASGDYETAANKRKDADREIEDAAKEQANRLKIQRSQSAAGKARPQLTFEKLSHDIDHDADARKKGLISQTEFDRRMALHAIEAKVMLNASKDQVDKVNQQIADNNRALAGQGYYKSLLGMSPDDFAKEQSGTSAAVQLYGLTPHNMDYLKKQYQAAEQLYRNSNKPDDLVALNNARNSYFGAIMDEVNKELQLALLQAPDEQSRRSAYQHAEQEYQQARVKFQQQNTRMKEAQKKQRDEQKRKQDIEDRGGSRHQMSIQDKDDPQAGNAPVLTDDEKTKREDEQRKARIKLTKDQRRAMDKELARQNRELTLAALQLKQAAYDDRQQGREILLNLQVAGTQDPIRQAALRVDEARRQVQDASSQWGNNSRQYRQALTDLRNAQVQQGQAILAGVQADDAILLAQAGDDPVAQARVAASNAQRELDQMRKNKADPNAIKQQRAVVIDSKRSARDAADQQLQDMARLRGELAAARAGDDPVAAARGAVEAARLAQQVAHTPQQKLQALVDLTKANNDLQDALVQRQLDHFDLLKSETDDPVQQAKLDLEAAKYALAHSKGTNKVKKQADYNNAKKAYTDAKISDSEDTINFEYQMDKITADEAAKQLEALANLKGVSKAKKRELLLQAKQLRDEASGDYELDVGSIRLPSLYEVKRFVQGGQPNASQIVTDNRNFTVYLGSADAVNAFAQQLEITNGTSAKATASSMMMR